MGTRDHSPSDGRRFYREAIYGGAVMHVDGVALRGQISNLSLGGAPCPVRMSRWPRARAAR